MYEYVDVCVFGVCDIGDYVSVCMRALCVMCVDLCCACYQLFALIPPHLTKQQDLESHVVCPSLYFPEIRGLVTMSLFLQTSGGTVANSTL